MGMFDSAYCVGPEFVCTAGHDLSEEEFQTKDLDCSLAIIRIEGGRAWYVSGGIDEIPNAAITETLCLNCVCSSCEAFVQAGTGNLIGVYVTFEVDVDAGIVKAIRRVSPPSAEQLAETPRQEWMAGCEGPMPYAEAKERHIHYPHPWKAKP